ncbi:UvrD-helicase domain-containing protein [Clostridium cochlearium]|nr:UvrD-helicase domain-containing protein [Clostridium cochlearium]SNV79177.1 UvrD/REP helicase [Clostridium cochlearium]
MENVNMEYSAIYYYSELDIQKINNIKKLLKTGIIVNLFLNYSFEVELELNEYNEIDFLKYAKSNGFLNIFDDLGELNYDEGLVAYDGNILNKSFYEDVCCSKENKFNNEQYEIINANTNKNIIVTASAGTGKTTAMINRLMFLRKTVKDFIFSNTILITFTNEASIEMRERLIEILEKYYSFTEDVTYLNMLSEVSETNISTIHSFAKSIIDEFSLNKSINEKIKITTFEDYKKLFLEEAIDKFSKEYPDIYLNVKYFPMYDLVNKIKTIWGKLDNHSIDLNSDKIKLDFGQDENKVSFLIEYVLRYANKKLHDIKENKLEVSDLMKRITNIELIQRINHNYKLIMVDEFQDIDNIQIKFITDLCKYKNLDLFSVGDEKQSIYRFRGAEYTAFKKLKEHLKYNPKQLLEFTLVQNYRTEAELLKDINNLFIDIDKRIFKFKYKENDYIYSKINTNKPNNIIYKSLKEDKNKVELLDKLLDKKQPEETIAILVRSNEDALEIKSMCDIYNIPCHVETKGDFYRQGVVKDFYLMIKSLIYLKDNRINYSLINSPYIKDTVNKKEIIERFNEEDKK